MKKDEQKQIHDPAEGIGDILLIPSTLRELEKNVLTNLCFAQQPLTTAEVKKGKGDVFFKIPGAYNTVDAALKRLEKKGYLRKTQEISGQKKKRVYEFWYVEPLFLQAWIQKKREIVKEINATPKSLRDSLYPESVLLFFGIREYPD